MLEEVETVKQLAEKLSRYEFISRFDSNDDREGWKMAIGFADISRSLTNINERLLPNLLTCDGSEEVGMLLIEIGEEFRHVLHHLLEMECYSFLKEFLREN